MPVCTECKRSNVAFDVFKISNRPKKRCVECNAESAKKKFAWKQTPSGKASIAKTNADPVVQANLAAHLLTTEYVEGRARVAKERAKDPEVRVRANIASSKWEKSDKGKHWRSENRWKKAEWRRAYENERMANDAAFRFLKTMRERMRNALKDECQSATFFAIATDFESAQDLADHLLGLAAPHGWTLENYGKVWQVDHTLACFWYDHANPEDRKRCWRAQNLVPMLGKSNREKSFTLPADDVLHKLGIDSWPVDWKGIPPTAQEREHARKFYVRVVRV